MRASTLIVTRGITPQVETLARRLISLECPAVWREVIVVAEDPDAAEPLSPETVDGVTIVRVPRGRGIAYNRNRGLDAAAGDVIVFVDDDCWPAETWYERLLAPLADETVHAVMGGVVLPSVGFLGDSISALGFPAGGSAGFDVMFRVDENGFTDHISTLNCALRRSTFDVVGPFDESLTAGAEDGELSYRIASAGLRIKFAPDAIVEHRARATLPEFGRWFFRRGRAIRQFSRRAPSAGVVSQRLASYGRIVRMHSRDPKLAAIVALLAASIVLQEAGFVWETLRR